MSKRVQLIIEGQLRTSGNVLNRKYPNPGFAIDRPLLGLTVGTAAVVDEAGVVGLAAGINHQVALKREKVEVGDVALLRLSEPIQTHGHVQDFPNVLHHKISLFDIMSGFESPAPPTSVKGDCVCRLLLSDPLVLTLVSSRTGFGVTFNQEGSVNAVRALCTGSVWCTSTWLNLLLQYWPGDQVLVALQGIKQCQVINLQS